MVQADVSGSWQTLSLRKGESCPDVLEETSLISCGGRPGSLPGAPVSRFIGREAVELRTFNQA